MSSLLSYHIFSFFISNFFENFKSRRNISKFTAGLCYRLLPVSVKIGGNRRLPIGKENTADDPTMASDGGARHGCGYRCRRAVGEPQRGHARQQFVLRPSGAELPERSWDMMGPTERV